MRLVARRYSLEQGSEEAGLAAARAVLDRQGDALRCLAVEHDGVVVGRVWLAPSNGDLGVFDVDLPGGGETAGATAGPGVRAALVAQAVEERKHSVLLSSSPDDAGACSVPDPAYGDEVAARQMRLGLADEPSYGSRGGGVPDVGVRPMTEEGYAAWHADELDAFAAELMGSGIDPDAAAEESRRQHETLLPEGLDTPDQHFFTGYVDGVEVGTLWIGTERPMAFVYDLVVHAEHRRRGYGAALMVAGARWARERGSGTIGLNVFGHNEGARRLYEQLGWSTTEEHWRVPVEGDGTA